MMMLIILSDMLEVKYIFKKRDVGIMKSAKNNLSERLVTESKKNIW